MKNIPYYYCEPGGVPRGPISLGEIQEAVTAGQLSEGVNLSTSPAGPWQRLTRITFLLREEKARADKRWKTLLKVLLVLTLCGGGAWLYLHQTKEKTAKPSSSTSKTAHAEEQQEVTETSLWETAKKCLHHLHVSVAIERTNEYLRIYLQKDLTDPEAQLRATQYKEAQAKAEKSWNDFQAALERLQNAESELGASDRFSRAILECKEYGIRLAKVAAHSLAGDNASGDKVLVEYDIFESLGLKEVIEGKYHGGYGEPERK